VEEEALQPEALRQADEAFLTSTLKGVLPIRRVDGWPVADGRPGRVTRRLMQAYDELTEAETKIGSPSGASLR
jgi:branched-subunit amino acid aminotransferase/4-amino-4-deoxychorismate lyase